MQTVQHKLLVYYIYHFQIKVKKETMELGDYTKGEAPIIGFQELEPFIFAARVNLQKILISIKFAVKKYWIMYIVSHTNVIKLCRNFKFSIN